MILRDKVQTYEPTHVLVTHHDEACVAFSIEYPEGWYIDEIEYDWISYEQGGWEPENGDALNTYTWAIMFICRWSKNGGGTHIVYMRPDHINLPDDIPGPIPVTNDPNGEWLLDEDDSHFYVMKNITKDEWESLNVIGGVTLLEVVIDEHGCVEVRYPDEEFRTDEQRAEIEGRQGRTYEEIIGAA